MRENTSKPTVEQVVAQARERQGLVTTAELKAQGVHPETLRRLVAKGRLARCARGMYRLTEAEPVGEQTLAIVAAAQPKAVVCLLSALFHHRIGTQFPHEVWLMLPRGTRAPRLVGVNVRPMWVSPALLGDGVERIAVANGQAGITTPARTVVDCFRYRNKVGLDVALEALREGWQARRFSLDDLRRSARLCRVENVMRPYLEALTA